MKFLPFLKSRHNQAVFTLIIANIIWGAASPIFKLALQNITPFTLAFSRFFFASLIILPFAYKKLKIEKDDWFLLLILSIVGVSIQITFFFLGLKHAPAINSPIIYSSGPIFIYLFSIIYLREKPHFRLFLGLCISLLGVLLIVTQPFIENGFDGTFMGNLFFVIATFCFVIHTIVSKKLIKKYKAITITFWSFFISSLFFLPLAFIEFVKYQSILHLDYRGYLGLIFGIFLCSALAYFLFEWAIENVEGQEVGLFTYIDPLTTIVIAVPLLGETITTIFVIGSIFVFLGIFIAEGRIHYHPLHKLKK